MKLSVFVSGEKPEKEARLVLRPNVIGHVIDVVLVGRNGLAIKDGFVMSFSLKAGKLSVCRRLGVNADYVNVNANGEIRLEENR